MTKLRLTTRGHFVFAIIITPFATALFYFLFWIISNSQLVNWGGFWTLVIVPPIVLLFIWWIYEIIRESEIKHARKAEQLDTILGVVQPPKK